MIPSVLIVSFLFESIYTNVVPLNSILSPLFLLTALIILYPYFKNKKVNFIIVSTIIGLFYDIALTNSCFVNTISLFFVGYLVIALYKLISYNIYGTSLINIIAITSYRIISYLLLYILDYLNFDIKVLFKGIYTSLISNVIYSLILFIIVKKICVIFNIKQK